MRLGSKEWHIYLIVAVCHILLCMPAFLEVRIHPMTTTICGFGDGIKNIFTMLSYVKEPIGPDGIFKYNAFAYPYGDYVYYTDNTPFFSIPFKFFCKYIADISAYTEPLYYLFLVVNIIVCGLLVYKVLKMLLGTRLFPALMAVALPWTTMMVQRITRGHYALSMSSLVLLAILLLIYWHQQSGQRKKQTITLAWMCLLSFASFMIHGYFFAIITAFVAFGLLFYGLMTVRKGEGWVSIIASGVYAVVSTAITLLTVHGTDKYLSLRKDSATGYDWMEQKVRVSALFSHMSFQTIYFPVAEFYTNNEPENAAYMGNVGLYGLAVLLIAMLFSKEARKFAGGMQKDFFGNKMLKTLFLAGLVLLSISMGEIYYTEKHWEDGYRVINILNPFFYLHQFTKAVEHFRSLERFIYPFYFTFYIWIAFMLVRTYEVVNKRVKVTIIMLFVFLAGAEIKDNVDRVQTATDIPDPLCQEKLDAMPFPKTIKATSYQAILPIPYYCVGSEDFDYTLNSYGPWQEYLMQMHLKTSLPLMSFALSRTPPAYNKALLELVAGTAADAGLMAKLNDKPILVALHKTYAADTVAPSIPANEHSAALYRRSLHFVERNQLSAIDSVNDVVFYEWYPKRGML